MKHQIGIVCDQRWRSHMEDTYFIHNLLEDGLLVGVFDGHGGAQIAEFARDNFEREYSKSLKKQSNKRQAIKNTFKVLDRKSKEMVSGSCAVVCHLIGNKLYWAHVGDCNLIIVTETGLRRLNTYHNKENKKECERMKKSGAVLSDGYFMKPDYYSGLNISRTIGDWKYSDIGVVCRPESRTMDLPNNSLYLILTTDGFLMDLELMSYITRGEKNPQKLVEFLARNSDEYDDNITLMAIPLR